MRDSHPPRESPSTRQYVYRHVAGGGALDSELVPLPESRWHQISSGQRPFEQPHQGVVRLIVVSWALGQCSAVDPVIVRIDSAGYLQTLDASLEPLPGAVVDLRERFIQKYLARCHVWYPAPQVLQQALELTTAANARAQG